VSDIKTLAPMNSNPTPQKPASMGAIAPTLTAKPEAPKKIEAAKVTPAKPAANATKKIVTKKAAPAKAAKAKTTKTAKPVAKKTTTTSSAGSSKKTTAFPSKNIFESSAEKMKKAFSENTFTPQAAKDNMLKFSRETADKLVKASDTATRGFSDVIEKSRGTIEAAMESSNVTSEMTRAFTSEMFRFTNESFSDNMEISKQIFNCKTVSDLMDMQSKIMRSNMDQFFNQTGRFSDMFFQFMSEATEPMTQQIATASKTMNKGFKF
jgi:hypothetical protein